jgi:hypothetical protein
MVEGCVGSAPVRPILERLATPRSELAHMWDAARPINGPSPVARLFSQAM